MNTRRVVMVGLPRLLLLSSTFAARAAIAQSGDSIRSFLRTVDIRSGRIETVYRAKRHFEAPNWSPDGRYFIVNSKGRLSPAARGRQHYGDWRDARDETMTAVAHVRH